MNARANFATSLLVLVLGVVSFLVSFSLENYRVERVQPNGLPAITYPLYLTGFILSLLGIGMLFFAVLFMVSPVASLGFRRAAATSALMAAGVPWIFLSASGVLVNYSEWGTHFCTSPQPDPVCGSIVWAMADFSVAGVVGVALIVTGVYLRLHRGEQVASVA
jgi:hypothetical protein